MISTEPCFLPYSETLADSKKLPCSNAEHLAPKCSGPQAILAIPAMVGWNRMMP